jgi:4-hydroxy-tetrahydrodipicolinate reductase
MVKIALSGACGKMGRVISNLISQRNDCKVIAGVDVAGQQYTNYPIVNNIFDLPETPDVVIDYSHPSALSGLLSYCKMKNVPLVIATTGYSKDEILEIKQAAKQIPIFFTFNMSIGINLLIDLARRCVKALGGQFDIEILEKHHNLKKDAPSGTAIMLAEAINEELNDKAKFVYDRHNIRKAREKEEIGIHSIRGGTIVGEHEIIFAGHDEIITLSHTALSKEVFAVGSINAAVFLTKQSKGLYEMKDLISEKGM